MKLSYSTLDLRRSTAGLCLLALALVAICAPVAYAQTVEATPQATANFAPFARFSQSTITSTSQSVLASRVPSVDAKGVIHYSDVNLYFDVDASGNITLAPGYPVVATSLNYATSGFKAGTYVGPSNVLAGKAFITVSGPKVVNGGGTEWTLSLSSGADPGTYPSTATWYAGSPTTGPLAARLKAAGITSTDSSYGVSGTGQFNFGWPPDGLLAFSQVGNTLSIYSYTAVVTDGGPNVDFSSPVDQITYTLK